MFVKVATHSRERYKMNLMKIYKTMNLSLLVTNINTKKGTKMFSFNISEYEF